MTNIILLSECFGHCNTEFIAKIIDMKKNEP